MSEENKDATDGNKRLTIVKEIAFILVSAILLSLLVKTFFIQAFYIPSESMMNTLQKGDRILVNKLTPGVFDVNRGDIIVFKDPGGWLKSSVVPEKTGVSRWVSNGLTFIGLLPQDSGNHLVKRVIGISGDHVVCCDTAGRITVNGQPIDETPYLKEGVQPSTVAFDQIVPDDKLWVMGDNRSDSLDSRYNQGSAGGGFVPKKNVVGTAFVKVWPLGRIGFLKNPGEVFEEVKKP